MDCESTNLSEFFDEPDAAATSFSSSAEDIFSILEAWEKDGEETNVESFEFHQKSSAVAVLQESDDRVTIEADQVDVAPSCKKQKLMNTASAACEEGQQRMTHITVERNRRKQMNEHLSVLRSLMPCFYVKRGDQASIIGGVVDYINELQQILQSLEAKKQRKAYTEVLSPRPLSSPRPPSLSPRKPPLSPRLSIPISPSTPQQSRPYKPWIYALNSPSRLPSPVEPSPSESSSNDSVNELVASSRSALAEVEVKFSGSNLVVKAVSHRIVQGQAVKIVATLEELELEILHVSISRVDETLLYSFTIKIGIECQLSAEELAQQIQQTFIS